MIKYSPFGSYISNTLIDGPWADQFWGCSIPKNSNAIYLVGFYASTSLSAFSNNGSSKLTTEGNAGSYESVVIKYIDDGRDPINGNWSEWSEFGVCDGNCLQSVNGSQTRSRTCTNPAPQYGGQICSGISTESRLCPLRCNFVSMNDTLTQSIGIGTVAYWYGNFTGFSINGYWLSFSGNVNRRFELLVNYM